MGEGRQAVTHHPAPAAGKRHDPLGTAGIGTRCRRGKRWVSLRCTHPTFWCR